MIGKTCATADEFGDALDAWIKDEVEPTITETTKAYVSAVYQYVTTLKTTWSSNQQNDIFTGQFRWSAAISIGSPAQGYLPTLDGQPWPTPNTQYTELDAIAGLETIASIGLYDIVYVTDSAPHADAVEQHTQIFALSAQLATQDMQSTDMSTVAQANSIPF